MGLVDIDDRDIYNHYYNSGIDINTSKEWLLRLKSANQIYQCVNLSKNKYKINFTVQCTGLDIESIINIPLVHSLDKIEIKHVDSNNVNSLDKLNYTVYKNNTYNLFLLLYKFMNVIHSDIFDELTGFTNDSSQYKIDTNSTNTDKLYISMYITVQGV